uniref:Uncharacterized protein n=1 Tax=Anguilla anguilla TaxID=7936 RepID=A0A0E9XGN9_ANGAN
MLRFTVVGQRFSSVGRVWTVGVQKL